MLILAIFLLILVILFNVPIDDDFESPDQRHVRKLGETADKLEETVDKLREETDKWKKKRDAKKYGEKINENDVQN